jgi:hypothetical protein
LRSFAAVDLVGRRQAGGGGTLAAFVFAGSAHMNARMITYFR